MALLGLPNAGKSTLLNRLVGEKLAIVTPKPQTTRSRTLGILSLQGAQVLLQDTPGLHEGRRPLDPAMNRQVAEAAADCDLALLLVDLTRGFRRPLDALLDDLRRRGTPVILVGTKADAPQTARTEWPPFPGGAAKSTLAGGAPSTAGTARAEAPPSRPGAGPGTRAEDPPHAVCAALRISARTGEGIDALLDTVVDHLPEAPPFYPDDELTDRPMRFLAAELVREAAFEALEQELPYRIAVEVLEFDESRPDLVRIRANILVQRDSQTRIVVGRGGETIKRIGTRARLQIEHMLGTRVHLDLRVKPDPSWTRPHRLKSLGYT